MFLGFGDSPDILEFSPDGALRRIIREERRSIRVTAEMKASLLAHRLSEIENENERNRIRAQFEEQPFPEYLPALGELFSDPHGFIWAQLYPVDADLPSTFHVFDAEGSLTAQVVLPPRFQVRAIGNDYVLGVTWDQYDVEYLSRLHLQREPRSER